MGGILGFLGISGHDRENELFVREYEHELCFSTRREQWADSGSCRPTQGVKCSGKSAVLATLHTPSAKLLKGSKWLCLSQSGKKIARFRSLRQAARAPVKYCAVGW